jgi:hypothetical protein
MLPRQEVCTLWQSSSSSMRCITPQTSCVLLSTVKVRHVISVKGPFETLSLCQEIEMCG